MNKDKMTDHFYNFRNPNGAKLQTWPPYNTKRLIQVLDLNIRTESDIYPVRNNFWLSSLYDDTITKQTKLGHIIGNNTLLSGLGKVYSFRGIPYGKPPIGPLRFKKPQQYGSWPTTLSAISYGRSCIQLNARTPTSEDCLFLNIFVPYTMSPSRPRSVMVWVHGGGYQLGNGNLDGEQFALLGNIILVTINYRLGPFGFFSTGDDASPGNYGLWDQRLAFQWVHDNIDDYGGDPSSVTIFGGSAGGGSVSFQSLYPGNQGLFQKVICESGAATSKMLRADQNSVKDTAISFIRTMNCSLSTSELSLNCLRSVPADIINQFSNILKNVAMPVVDGDFVKGTTEDILEKKQSDMFQFFKSLDYMVGTLSGDGSALFLTKNYLNPEVLQKYNSSFASGLSSEMLCKYFVPNITNILFPTIPSLQDQICQIYRNNESLAKQGNAIIDLLTDAFFTFPGMIIANQHYNAFPFNKATYVYYMTRVNPLQQSFIPYYTYNWTKRAVHGEKNIYMFHFDSFPSDQQEDVHLAKTMLSYWTNFAKKR